MIFVDTSAWFASIVPTDIDHFAASQWLSQNQQTLITTDFIIDEILTLLKVRGECLYVLNKFFTFFIGEYCSGCCEYKYRH